MHHLTGPAQRVQTQRHLPLAHVAEPVSGGPRWYVFTTLLSTTPQSPMFLEDRLCAKPGAGELEMSQPPSVWGAHSILGGHGG